MTQQELLVAIDCQRQIVADRPYDPNEQMTLAALYQALRRTFYVVKPTPDGGHVTPNPQYVPSKSGAVLKPAN